MEDPVEIYKEIEYLNAKLENCVNDTEAVELQHLIIKKMLLIYKNPEMLEGLIARKKDPNF